MTLPAAVVAEALRQVVRAATTDDARAVLTGVLLAAEDDGLRMVATDSYRLAVRDLPEFGMLASGQKVIVPEPGARRAAAVLGDVEELTVRLGAREAMFESGARGSRRRLIEGEYPNYRNLLPSTTRTCSPSGASLLEAIRRVKILAQDSTPVRLAPRRRHRAAHRDHPGRRQRGRGDRCQSTRAPR